MKRYSIWLLIWVFTVSIVSLNACSENNEEAKVKHKQNQVAMTEFLQQAATNDIYNITAGMMAEDQAKKKSVSKFGNQLVNLHSRTSEALVTIAKRKSVPLPEDLPADKKNQITKLEVKEGPEFDESFADAQITAHQEAIAMYEKADKEISDQDVQAFIDQILPVIKENLTDIKKVRTELVSKK